MTIDKAWVSDATGARNEATVALDADRERATFTLARPVAPEGGEARVLIDKTYEDAASYRVDGGGREIVFTRPLGIKRNAVVLPAGYLADRYLRTRLIAVVLASWGAISGLNAIVRSFFTAGECYPVAATRARWWSSSPKRALRTCILLK